MFERSVRRRVAALVPSVLFLTMLVLTAGCQYSADTRLLSGLLAGASMAEDDPDRAVLWVLGSEVANAIATDQAAKELRATPQTLNVNVKRY